jgi:uncharacterized protein (DUF2235 family)
MAKNIVVLLDGTGQEGGKASALNTNVYRLFNMLEDRTPRQVVYYDHGLGTDTGWRKVTGNIGGAGVSDRIKKAYRFIFDHYEAGDWIFLIGFSRGAATVRSLSSFIDHFGILPQGRPELIERAYEIYKTRPPAFEWLAIRAIDARGLDRRWAKKPENLDENWKCLEADLYPGNMVKEEGRAAEAMMRDIKMGEIVDEATRPKISAQNERASDVFDHTESLYKAYADEILAANDPKKDPRKFVRAIDLRKRAVAFLAANHGQSVPIEFVGCFDTVAALGLPLRADAIANWIPGLQHDFHNFGLRRSVRHAYHALAIDEKRKLFAPVPWTLDEGDDKREDGGVKHPGDSPGRDEQNRQTLRQVWFTGVHTDIGGGYPSRGLSDITLAWMLRQAHNHGLLIYAGHKERIFEDFTDVMNDSRATFTTKMLYRRAERNLEKFGPEKPVVHQTVPLRKAVPEILVWEKDKPLGATKKGSDYDPWILRKDRVECDEEVWDPYNHDELLAAQEKKWKDWQSRIEAKEKKRLTDIYAAANGHR